MKRILSLTVLSLAAALFAFAQFGCANPQPTTSTNTNMATPAPTPDKAAIEAELTKIENDWPRIVKERDGAAVKKIEADDGVFLYPDGTFGDKASDIQDMESGAVTADSWEISELQVHLFGNDTAVVTGRNNIKGGKYKGQPFPFEDFRWVDTFLRRNGQWQLVAGTSTPIPKNAAAAASPSPKASPAASASPAVKSSSAAKASPGMKPSAAASPAKTKTPN